MESFTALKEMVNDPEFLTQKQKTVGALTDDMMDDPLIVLVNAFNKLPYCFTLQSCYGHFVYDGRKDPYNIEPLRASGTVVQKVEYRIAYIAFCLENSRLGRVMLDAFTGIPVIDPNNIQVGCAGWFWKQHVNSYVLQVKPNRFKEEDTALLDFDEALVIEQTRDTFFSRLSELAAL